MTEKCCNDFVKDKEHLEIKFKYNGRVEQYKVAVDMPVNVTQNLKKLDLYTMMEFTIEDIDKDDEVGIRFLINGSWFSTSVFSESFIPAFCLTVYKYQGADVDEHHNILISIGWIGNSCTHAYHVLLNMNMFILIVKN